MSNIGFINRCAICGKSFGSEQDISREEATALVLRGTVLNHSAACSEECLTEYRKRHGGKGPSFARHRPLIYGNVTITELEFRPD